MSWGDPNYLLPHKTNGMPVTWAQTGLNHWVSVVLCSAASQWFCNGSVYTEPSVIHTNGSVIVLYGSVIVL